MEKSDEYKQAFKDLENGVSTETARVLEEFTCRLYGASKLTSTVNRARIETFLTNYSFTDTNKEFKINIKNTDASSLPPCSTELQEQFLRASFIAKIWRNAYRQVIENLSPVNHGWIINEEKYAFCWFKGNQLPSLVNDVILQPELERNEQDEQEEEGKKKFKKNNDLFH